MLHTAQHRAEERERGSGRIAKQRRQLGPEDEHQRECKGQEEYDHNLKEGGDV